MDAEQREVASTTMRNLGVGDDWLAAIEPNSPEWIFDLVRRWIEIYKRGDVEALLAASNPEIEIVQPPQLPDPQRYHGREGVIEMLLDWPQEWEDFRVEVKRIFATGDQILVDAIHSGRSRAMGIAVEATVVFLYAFDEEGRMRRQEMYLSVDEALRAVETK